MNSSFHAPPMWRGAAMALYALLSLGALTGAAAHLSGVAQAETVAPTGPTVLTVSGAITAGNRGPFDAFEDGFLNYHEKSFDAAYAFDRAMLEALPQHTVSAMVEGWPQPVEARGPRLRDVLTAAGAGPNATLFATALDGYAAEFSAEELAAQDWILAIDVDGAPLGVGGRGPTWILYGTGVDVASADAEAQWVWSVFLLEVE